MFSTQHAKFIIGKRTDSENQQLMLMLTFVIVMDDTRLTACV